MAKYEYKVVRSYGPTSIGKTDDLERAFRDGYEFVRASEYVPEITHSGVRRYGYIEYILRKEVEE